MEMYPDRVYSKPEFTALPPYLFSGADFALIPSRDEPFGLVAVEFGRKGALGVGSRLGGLGLMPGWVRSLYYNSSSIFTNDQCSGSRSSQHPLPICSHSCRRQSKWPLSLRKKNVHFFVHDRPYNVSLWLNGVNVWKISINAVSILADNLPEKMHGDSQMAKRSTHHK